MPNWCQNVAYIKHEDKAELDKIIAELDKKDEAQFFNSLVPNPNGEWQYDWSVSNWGCKWDASVYEYWYEEEADHLYISFDTAWGPPTVFYDKLGEMGFEVRAFYREEGMGFAGLYDNGDDDYYEYGGMSADEIEEQLPTELDEMFSISQYQRDCEMDEEDSWDAEAELEKIMMPEKPNRSQVDTPEGREWLRGLLHDTEVTVTFTKKDGTERAMVCTLVNDKIPSEKAPKNTGKTHSDEAIAVFDVEKQDWRSFRWDSVKKIEFSIG